MHEEQQAWNQERNAQWRHGYRQECNQEEAWNHHHEGRPHHGGDGPNRGGEDEEEGKKRENVTGGEARVWLASAKLIEPIRYLPDGRIRYSRYQAGSSAYDSDYSIHHLLPNASTNGRRYAVPFSGLFGIVLSCLVRS